MLSKAVKERRRLNRLKRAYPPNPMRAYQPSYPRVSRVTIGNRDTPKNRAIHELTLKALGQTAWEPGQLVISGKEATTPEYKGTKPRVFVVGHEYYTKRLAASAVQALRDSIIVFDEDHYAPTKR